MSCPSMGFHNMLSSAAPSSPLLFCLASLSLLFHLSMLQPVSPLVPSPAPASDGCNGVELKYSFGSRDKIRPFINDSNEQPFAFQATASVENAYTSDLLSWTLIIQFQYRELIVTLEGAVLTDGSNLPYNTTSDGGNGTSLSGFPLTNLKTPIETAGDATQYKASFSIVGTLFGAPPPAIPLPAALSLDDPAWLCPAVNKTDKNTSSISTCCVPNPNFNPNATDDTGLNSPTYFLPRRTGDLTIAYDVIQSYQSSYLALVTIANHSPLGRLDHWHLSWEWQRGEFIYQMRGAYPTYVDTSGCILGKAAQYYQSLDFSKVLNCEKRPTIIDLPPERYNDTLIGLIEHCCRNGTILPAEMDPSQSMSAFQVQVFKLPPDNNLTKLYPPANFKIYGEFSPNYQCGQAIPVSPAKFPDPSGLDSETLAIASWQVVCNISKPKGSSPKCCVSYSAFYNDSVVPCRTCACGCPVTPGPRTCNATTEALLLPPEALLLPFDNRTLKALAWAEIKHFKVPSPMPCGDFCGVSINWHISTDYTKGWSARVTLFNWEEGNFANWFLAVRMDKAYDGYEQMYSFNGTAMGNNTIFMQGLPGLNYLMGETNGSTVSDPLVPGKQQSVISFTKKSTPGINIVAGDGFPTKVYFNGYECALPDIIPSSQGFRSGTIGVLGTALLLIISAVLMLEL